MFLYVIVESMMMILMAYQVNGTTLTFLFFPLYRLFSFFITRLLFCDHVLLVSLE
jgi:hypothetical protein